MQIKVINGNTFAPMTQGIHASAVSVCAPNTTVVTVQPNAGPESLESYYDEALAAPGILEQIRLDDGVSDAFIIACWGDPALEAARELTTKPVLGIAEASIVIANFLAARWGVISTLDRDLDLLERTIYRAGAGRRCVSIRTTNLKVIETETAREATVNALEVAARLAIIEDKVEAICLGCAGMSGLDHELENRLGIPVIDSVAAAVKLAEAVVGLGKLTSKALTYRKPEPKRILGFSDLMQSYLF
ncbi:MAG: aspartate/glutamate racemase family protein [Synechococcales cyanobacterium]